MSRGVRDDIETLRAREVASLKRVRGELKSLGKHMDSWESEEHSTVTIRFMRQWIARMNEVSKP